MHIATILHGVIAAACPITGIRIGDPKDSSTWSFDATDAATPSQIAAANKALSSLSPTQLDLRRQAHIALAATDLPMKRVSEAIALGQNTAGSKDVTAWVGYVRALRAIANGSDTKSAALPTEPPFPAGT